MLLKDVDVIALDLETTGLDPVKDHIVSIGMVQIRNFCIDLESAWHRIIYTPKAIPEDSAVIHSITDDAVATGEDLTQLVPTLLDKLKGKVLLVHHAAIESGFLNNLCQSLYGQEFCMPVIDTEVLARRQIRRTQQAIQAGQLRLFNLRERYHLPAYKAHNALSDALATSELFLALVNELCPKLDCRLKDVLTN